MPPTDENFYTAAEIRMMASRRQCEDGKHRPQPQMTAATSWFYGHATVSELYPTSHTFECDNCDAIVTIEYPKIGRSPVADPCSTDPHPG